MKKSSKRSYQNKERERLYKHWNKNVPGGVKDRRYIKGVINAKIQEQVNPRRRGEQTTDPEVRQRVLEKCGGRCFYCHRKYTRDSLLAKNMPRLYFDKLEIDHIVPHSKRGPNWAINYVAACRRCNQLKSDHTLAHFRFLLAEDQSKRGY